MSGPVTTGGGPSVSPALAAAAAARVREGRTALLGLKTGEIIRAMDRTVAEWLGAGSPRSGAAQAAFCSATGMPVQTAPFRPLLESCRGRLIKRWVKSEVRPLRRLEGGPAPALTVHGLPGNVPLVWLPAFLACLLVRSPCLLKPAADDPDTAALLVETLVEKLPDLAPALAVLPWTGGDEDVEREVLGAAEAVIAYGSDAAVGALSRRLPPEVRWIGHGARTAAGVIAREEAAPRKLDRIADRLARDVMEYDGRGCLSLTTVFVEEGGRMTARQVAERLAGALARASEELPPGRPDRDAAAVTQTWRGRMRARELAHRGGCAFGSERGLAWTVFYDPELPPFGFPLVRALWVSPLAGLDDLPGRLAGLPTPAHALACAGSRARKAAAGLREAGSIPTGLHIPAGPHVTRAVPFGELQRPPLEWAPGGASWFAQLLGQVPSPKSQV